MHSRLSPCGSIITYTRCDGNKASKLVELLTNKQMMMMIGAQPHSIWMDVLRKPNGSDVRACSSIFFVDLIPQATMFFLAK